MISRPRNDSNPTHHSPFLFPFCQEILFTMKQWNWSTSWKINMSKNVLYSSNVQFSVFFLSIDEGSSKVKLQTFFTWSFRNLIAFFRYFLWYKRKIFNIIKKTNNPHRKCKIPIKILKIKLQDICLFVCVYQRISLTAEPIWFSFTV